MNSPDTDPKRLDLSSLRIDIDRADDEVLKLALITVGLNRDIENLFHPRIHNGELVKTLCQHDNIIIQQYSVWSVIENRRLSINDLGISTDKLADLKPNVQSKFLQLIAEMEPDYHKRLHVTEEGSLLPSSEARVGLAKGVKNNYYDGLEQVVLPWFEQETHRPVRELLAEHFASHSEESSLYDAKALELSASAPELTARLLVGAEGKSIYQKIKAIKSAEGTGDLFDGTLTDGDLIYELKRGTIVNTISNKVNKVLILSASPKDEQRLRVDQEYRDLRDKIRALERPEIDVKIKLEVAVRTDQLQDALLNEKPDIVHFSGHGSTGNLCFEDVSGNAVPVDADAFSSIIKLTNDTVRCVVLNACFTESVAQSVKPHVDCVIGCNDSINDDAAIAFSKSFYQAIAAGKPYNIAFDFGVAGVKVAGYPAEAAKYRCI